MTTRTYRSTRRDEAASITRAVILDTALERFTAQGYSATTIADIATHADVAVNTIYASIGGKAQLVLALIERARTDPSITSTLDGVGRTDTGRAALERLAHGVRTSSEHSQRVIAVMQDAAASEPSVADAVHRTELGYRANLDSTVGHLRSLPDFRDELDTRAVQDALWFYFGFSPWRTLIALGWDWDRTEHWLALQAWREIYRVPQD
ncbi:TetR/AcrR family transcriptional regulator [Plantibacter sp. Mn2098]|uniref:TetR/AcrR family transcriptional regulator n=1 Tax=Plantibacter sp. Mn2098 TaxID=3395266 RepID=UPI003BEBC083